jgi:4-alpha-glucanotransferase
MDLSLRRSGVVLHFTSLPGPHGSGDLGPDAHRFIDWLAAAGQSVWQVLPVNPIGPGDSPYQSPSAFAGNPLLVALEPLVERGWLDACAPPAFDGRRVNYREMIPWRSARLNAAAAGFFARANKADRSAFAAWRDTQRDWLADGALFAALKDAHGGQPWWAWAPGLAQRDGAALAAARAAHAPAVAAQEFVQWCFDVQIAALRAHACSRGVHLMGDLPIFVAHDSADVWARPDLYFLDAQHQPTVVAGVPPDGYTPDGQRWGNPLYRWRRMADEGFAWWLARVRRALVHADLFRIDHFRGFAGYWEVPATCPTARDGRWVPGPGKALFTAIEAAFAGSHGRLPIVAEDLGTITPDVTRLRDDFGYPGMRIVQEAFGGDASHPFLPHHFLPACLAYTSTHDSDTALGWWQGAPAAQRAFATDYLGLGDECISQALMRAASTSVADLALAPMQDVLGLDGSHRMNLPGTATGNWSWRFDWAMVGESVAPGLARLALVTDRRR